MKAFVMIAVLALSCTKTSTRGTKVNPAPPPTTIGETPSTPEVTITSRLHTGLEGTWLATMGTDDACSLVYSIQTAESLLTSSMSCFDKEARVIHRETRRYKMTPGQEGEIALQLQESTCAPAMLQSEMSLYFALGTFSSGIPALELRPTALVRNGLVLAQSKDRLDADFLAASKLYRNLPITPGCFGQGQAGQFVAQ